MLFPPEAVSSLIRNSIVIGDVYSIKMDSTDGITPKDGYSTRLKFFIVLGFDDEDNIYGGVVINSNINLRLPDSITDFYYPIHCKKYSFLRHDSFVNCSHLMTTTTSKLLEGDKAGVMDKEDLASIIETVCESPNENKMQLRQFGLIKQ